VIDIVLCFQLGSGLRTALRWNGARPAGRVRIETNCMSTEVIDAAAREALPDPPFVPRFKVPSS
jgi:hypothetical protein